MNIYGFEKKKMVSLIILAAIVTIPPVIFISIDYFIPAGIVLLLLSILWFFTGVYFGGYLLQQLIARFNARNTEE